MRALAVTVVLVAALGARARAEEEAPELGIELTPPRPVQGWPLIVVVDVRHAAGPLVIAGAKGAWTDALVVEIVDAKGDPARWPLAAATAAAGTLTVDGATEGRAGWVLAPDQTAALREGKYKLRARLDTSAASAGWRGVARSREAELVLRKAPAAPSPDERAERQLTLASYHAVRNETGPALADLDALLAEQPKHIAGLTFKCDLLAELNRPQEALAACDAALAAVKPGGEPIELLHRRAQLIQKLIH